MVALTLAPLWDEVAFHICCTVWPSPKDHRSVHPLIPARPVFLIVTPPWNPPGRCPATRYATVMRPLAGWAGLLGGRTGPRERAVIAFFGVRGVGSLFYLVYALQAGEFAEQNALWRIVGLVLIGSILLHGLSAPPIMWLLDRKRRRKARAQHDEPSRTHV